MFDRVPNIPLVFTCDKSKILTWCCGVTNIYVLVCAEDNKYIPWNLNETCQYEIAIEISTQIVRCKCYSIIHHSVDKPVRVKYGNLR